MAHSIRLWLETQRPGVCSDVYGTVHYKDPLKLFDKSRVLPFFAIFP